jgi:hypothetical protein
VLGQHFQRHVPAQGELYPLVDDAHAATADLAEDAKVAQPLQLQIAGEPNASPRALVVLSRRAGSFHIDQERK